MFKISELFEGKWHDPSNKEAFKSDARKIKEEHKAGMDEMKGMPDFMLDSQKKITKNNLQASAKFHRTKDNTRHDIDEKMKKDLADVPRRAEEYVNRIFRRK